MEKLIGMRIIVSSWKALLILAKLVSFDRSGEFVRATRLRGDGGGIMLEDKAGSSIMTSRAYEMGGGSRDRWSMKFTGVKGIYEN